LFRCSIQRLQKEVKSRGSENDVSFDFSPIEMIGSSHCGEILNQYDVAMCCPDLNFFIKKITKENTFNCALYLMPPRMYGTLYFDEVYQDAKDVYDEFKKTKVNPFHFPGEERVLAIKRMEAYRNKDQHKYD